MKKLLILLLLPLLLGGCTTSQIGNMMYTKRMNSWIGAKEVELLNVFGAPISTYEVDGKKALSFVANRCKTNFIISGGLVETYSWVGDCRESILFNNYGRKG